MGAKAAKNPVTGSYPDLASPLQVDAPGPDPRPGSDARIYNAMKPSDPLGWVPKVGVNKGHGIATKRDKSLGGGRGGKK